MHVYVDICTLANAAQFGSNFYVKYNTYVVNDHTKIIKGFKLLMVNCKDLINGRQFC